MEMEPVAGYEFANWQKGYGDFHLVPDFRTLRQASWLDRTAVVLCDLQSEHDHALIESAPRTMLLKQIEAASKLGYDAMAASELEYYFFRNSYRDAAAAEYRNLEPAGWYLEDITPCRGPARRTTTAFSAGTSSSRASRLNRLRANGGRASTK